MPIRKFLRALQLRFKMLATHSSQARPFQNSLLDPQNTQLKTLIQILKENQLTAFGQRHDFSSITGEREYQAKVPISGYEELRPFIERQLRTGTLELNPDKPILYLQTSGTTGAPKYIPLREKTLEAYKKAQAISCAARFRSVPGIFSGKILPIVSPMIEGHLPEGSPFGSMSGVVNHALPELLFTNTAIPESVFEITDYEMRYLVIAAYAVSDAEVSCLASANPTTFIKLHDIINQNAAALINVTKTGDITSLGFNLPKLAGSFLPNCRRAAALTAMLQTKGSLSFGDLWPSLKAVVTWTSGNCSMVLPKLQQLISESAKIIDMGYLASEFWGTIILDPTNSFGSLTIQDNFFEFIEQQKCEAGNRETILISDLEQDKRYYIIVTTRDGLYRYFINDIIEVSGKVKNTPSIAFVQKGKGVTNLTGEKLYESQVIQAVQDVADLHKVQPSFFIMLADRKDFSYFLYLESDTFVDAAQFSSVLNSRLGELNLEYRSKIDSGRLRAVQVRRLKQGTYDIYKRASIKVGTREAQFKPLRLQYIDEINFQFQDHEAS